MPLALVPVLLIAFDSVLRLGDGGFVQAWSEFLLCFAGLALLSLVVVRRRTADQGGVLRIDDSGITVLGARTVGWDEIRVVRVVRRSGVTAVVPIPREGMDLPMLDLGLFRSRSARRAARNTRRWGGPLVIVPRALDADEARITAAVRQFGRGVPVMDAPDPHTKLPEPR